MLKKIIVFPLSLIIFFFLFSQASSAQFVNYINIYFFWGEGCPHCAKEKPFLEFLAKKYPQIKVYDFEIYNNNGNIVLLQEIGKKLKTDIRGVPFTVIGDQIFVGYSPGLTDSAIERRVQYCLMVKCPDSVAEIIIASQKPPPPQTDRGFVPVIGGENGVIKKVKLPFFGEIDVAHLSLPILTIILGAADGFNPCAMWTLLFLISLLIGMHNKIRMWILGSAFIIASAAVYFIFMAAWLQLILFLGFIIWIRVLIGIVALGGGFYNLREYWMNTGGCKITGTEKRRIVFEKLKLVTQERNFWFALAGIIILAFLVNLVELICSAGLPTVYTQVLALSHLPTWEYYLYMLLYILFFMLDDLFVFFTAMITLQMVGITTKYSRYSHLIGGILMLIIGILLIFKPEWLMFG